MPWAKGKWLLRKGRLRKWFDAHNLLEHEVNHPQTMTVRREIGIGLIG
jgi:hypothetical protein